ncbi:MAG: hypothetical protein P1R58_05175 [bacterium]|nr:hypothetical protein [bacterium]
MRKLRALLLAVVTIATCSGSASIINNSTTGPSSEDSLSFVLYSLDSLGNPTTADSLFLIVSGPSGAIVYSDSIPVADSRVVSTTVHGRQFYSFKEQVSNIDGSGSSGVYTIALLMANSSLDLETPHHYTFQIIGNELDDQLASIGDSVLVKGGAVDSNRTEQGGGLDSSGVASAVWNSSQSNHTIAGTFGRYLDAQVANLSSGSGAYAVSVVAYDSSLGQVIPKTNLAVRNLAQTALIAVVSTNLNGQAVLNLDAGDYITVGTASGYIFEAGDTMSVTGAGVDTLFGYQFDPGAPSLPVFCRVYGAVYLADGTPEIGAAVKVSIPSGVSRWDNIIVSPFDVSTTTDSIGYFYVDLIPSDSLIPSGTQYEISIFRSNGTLLRQKVTVPTSLSWRLEW